MDGLRTVLTPFAPDQSGAVSVLYEMGGLVVILDAGGCTGNICGFDEPRWMMYKSAVMSAGLRDMDAILGRDKLLVEKVKAAVKKITPKFVAIIGTPVPAVIGTDFKGLVTLVKKEIPEDIEVFAVATYGMKNYDVGADKAYKELVKTYVINTDEPKNEDGEYIGVWGATPLDTNETGSEGIKEVISQRENVDKSKILCFGLGDGIDAIKKVRKCKKNIAISISGFGICRLLESELGIDYECYSPLTNKNKDEIEKAIDEVLKQGKEEVNVLVVGEQIYAKSVKDLISNHSDKTNTVTATYFLTRDDVDDTLKFAQEDDFTKEFNDGNYDIVVADPVFKDLVAKRYLVGDDAVKWIDTVHFAISGTWESKQFVTGK
ncbi:Nitrogenase component 1 type Oxidoreductase [Eubacterium uniforme]|uniref:Nitrogenase component 1 type Oxidoreductase n=1 Tax=Eubacterium uniforme TaxID=39495 RepID=A0A1T4VBY1_9FIRM|nr:nitrogenase component 1 [Eubacterium uniforme]SKA62464.1 Nitrogenase component 1 type Oxidoreductase [Eubacterium uniforme]